MKSAIAWCRTGICIYRSIRKDNGVSCYDCFIEIFYALGHVSWLPCSEPPMQLSIPQSRCSELTDCAVIENLRDC